MNASIPEDGTPPEVPSDPTAQPLRDGDSTADPRGATDPAQAEWETAGTPDPEADEATATGGDPAELPGPDDQIPAEDLHAAGDLPESAGLDPLIADIGPDGEGDLSPNDI